MPTSDASAAPHPAICQPSRVGMLGVETPLTDHEPNIRVARRLKAIDVIDVLSALFILQEVPGYIRSDNGPEFVAKSVRAWITGVGAKTATSAPVHRGRTAMSRASTLACGTNS